MVLLPEAILMMMELVVSVRKEGCLLRNWVSEAGGVGQRRRKQLRYPWPSLTIRYQATFLLLASLSPLSFCCTKPHLCLCQSASSSGHSECKEDLSALKRLRPSFPQTFKQADICWIRPEVKQIWDALTHASVRQRDKKIDKDAADAL